MMLQTKSLLLITLLSAALAGCGAKKNEQDQAEASKSGPKPTLVSVTQVKKQAIDITEQSVGSLEGLTNPTVSSEVAAKVIRIHVNTGQAVKQGQLIATLDATDFSLQAHEAQAEVARIDALLANQNKIVERNQVLVSKKFISQNALDNDSSQLAALKEQWAGARARLDSIKHNSSKTKVYAPAAGKIEKKLIDDGEFLRVGDPIVLIVSSQLLRAHLPFPEQIGAKLKPGLKVRLSTPTSSQSVDAVIHELKPMITEGSRSVDVIADVTNAPGWQAGASVDGTVVLGTQADSLMVPEQSVVLRPAGEVVYLARGNKAYQAIVKTGVRQNGLVEILQGLNENDAVVVDGAGFLTDQALIKLAVSSPTSPSQKANH
jgi:membrane fusion protein (multidrug efflux system)